LRAALLSLNDGRDAVMSDLGDLAEGDGPYGYHAREILGLASLNEKDFESATATFNALSVDLAAPLGVRERAKEFAALAAEAKAGVNIFGEATLEDVLKTVGAPALDDGAVEKAAETETTADDGEDDHDGHDDQSHEE